MHVRDGVLCPEVCAAAGVIAATAIGVSLRAWRRSQAANGSLSVNSRDATVGVAVPFSTSAQSVWQTGTTALGSVASLIFLGQMVNYPLPGLEVSGHLLGGALATMLMGPAAATLAVTLVLIVQALLFADGGWSALGVNITNIAVIGCWGTAAMQFALRNPGSRSISRRLATAAVAGFVSVLLATLAFALELALSVRTNPVSLTTAIGPLLSYHLGIAVVEGALTAGTLGIILIASRAPKTVSTTTGDLATASRATAAGTGLGAEPWSSRLALGLGLFALIAAPWASPYPDGLEAAGEASGFTAAAVDRVAFLADYSVTVPGLTDTILAEPAGVLAAGMLGLLVVWTLAAVISSLSLGAFGGGPTGENRPPAIC